MDLDLIPAPVWELTSGLPDTPSPGDVARLRATLPAVSPDVWQAAITQTLLRRRGQPKLGSAVESLWLTDAGLQQASRPIVAVRRARLLAEAGHTRWVDLGCGLGVDSLAAARAGLAVTAVEIDEPTARAARHNLTRLAPDARVMVADLRSVAVPADSVAFVDPARRSASDATGGGRRALDPADWSPPWQWLRDFASRHPRTVAKVAPGIDRDLPGPEVAVEWVSVGGDLVEATLWFPGVRDGRPPRTATLLRAGRDVWDEGTEVSVSGAGDPAPETALSEWLLEPDAAIIRSGLVGEVAALIGGGVISPGIAYLSSPQRPSGEWGRVSRVLDVLPPKIKELRAEVRRRGFGSVEIRTRGVGVDPQRVRRGLDLTSGGPPASLVMTRVSGRATALLVDDDAVPGTGGGT